MVRQIIPIVNPRRRGVSDHQVHKAPKSQAIIQECWDQAQDMKPHLGLCVLIRTIPVFDAAFDACQDQPLSDCGSAVQINAAMRVSSLSFYGVLDLLVVISTHKKERAAESVINIFEIVIRQVAAAQDQVSSLETIPYLRTVNKRQFGVAQG